MSLVSAVLVTFAAVQAAFYTLSGLGLTDYLYPKDSSTTVQNATCYDFIVVGGGTAGSVVAARLAAAGRSVLLVEAGGNPPIEANMPATLPYLLQTSVDWGYKASVNNVTAAYHTNNVINVISGKMISGSSNMFGQYHIRSDPETYDEWAVALNDPTWNYESLLPYFIKSETVYDADILAAYPSLHGTEGPIGLRRYLDSEIDAYIAAFEELGHAYLLEKNSNNIVGYLQPLQQLYDESIQATGRKYLGLVKDSEYLTVLKNTLATKVIFDASKAATGVEVITLAGETFTFTANNEVIISAGVYKTPQLLMLSGVGPKDHLESLNIPVVADLPVGDNLQDIYGALLGFKMQNSTAPPKITSPYEPIPYFAGFVTVNSSQTYPNYLTDNFLIPHGSNNSVVYCSGYFSMTEDISESYVDVAAAEYNTYLSVVANLSPKSRGSVRLNSTNPTDAPLIVSGYLDDPQDLEDLKTYVNNHMPIINTTYFRNAGAEFIKPNLTDCASYEVGTTEYWECYIPRMITSLFKYTSTCAMGSVVDSRLSVKNVRRVRVVDASVFPIVTRSHPIATVLALAEKAADMILQDNHLLIESRLSLIYRKIIKFVTRYLANK